MTTIDEHYIFDPIQFKEFGYEFFEDDGFYYRYQLSSKLFWKTIYIPFGPNCTTKQGFLNFIQHINKIRFIKKIIIDLPMIYCKKRKEEIIKILADNGYKKVPYVYQDEETILFKKEEFGAKSQLMNKVRHGCKKCKIVVKNNLTENEFKEIYDIYLNSSKKIGFKPKNISIFKKMSESCVVSLAYSEDRRIQGFVFGYLFDICAKDFYNKDTSKILLVMFTAQTDWARENRIGHAMHYNLFKKSFEEYNVDIIDFHGASRTKKRTYLSFKCEFSKNFYSLPGSFVKK